MDNYQKTLPMSGGSSEISNVFMNKNIFIRSFYAFKIILILIHFYICAFKHLGNAYIVIKS